MILHGIVNVGLHSLPLAALAGLYLLLLQFRRKRWKTLARELGAVYRSDGFLRPGRIEGQLDGRSFVICSNVSSSSIFLHASNPGIPLGATGEYFAAFPDWRFAFTIGTRPECDLITRLVPPQALLRLPDHHRPAFQSLFTPFVETVRNEKTLAGGAFWFYPNMAEFRCTGIIRGRDRVLKSVQVLAMLAGQVERSPIGL